MICVPFTMLKFNGLYFWVYIVEWRCFFDNNEFQEYIKRGIQNFLDILASIKLIIIEFRQLWTMKLKV